MLTAPLSLTLVKDTLEHIAKAQASKEGHAHKPLNEFLLENNTPEILLRLYSLLRTTTGPHAAPTRLQAVGLIGVVLDAVLSPTSSTDPNANGSQSSSGGDGMDLECLEGDVDGDVDGQGADKFQCRTCNPSSLKFQCRTCTPSSLKV